MPVNARDSAGTSRVKAGTRQGQTEISRDKQGYSLFCPCLSLSFPVCPCLSLLVLFCPCLSLSVPLCLYNCFTFMSSPTDEYNSLHQYEHSYIYFPCKCHCSNSCKLFFLTSSLLALLASSIPLSFNPNSSFLVIDITKASTWFLSSFVFQCKLMLQVTFVLHFSHE